MTLSEYAHSEYEQDSEFVFSDQADSSSDHSHLDQNTHHQSTHLLSTKTSSVHVHQDSLSNSNASIASQSRSIPTTPPSILSTTSNRFVNHVNLIMNKVKNLASDQRWNRVLKHRSGVEVFVQKNAKTLGKSKIVPIFKGVGLIKGHSPASVFAVIGSSKLWDEWYEDGNLVENLSDQVSLTYMCMKAGLGTRTRDLSLVEKVEATPEGAIYFCASSVDTPRVPTVPGRIRAHIELNGWVLEPVSLPSPGSPSGPTTPATKVTYYLQVNVKTFVVEAISQRYLARRPLCITKIDGYLHKHGSPIQLDEMNDSQAQPSQGGTRRSYTRGFLSVHQLELPKDNSPSDGSLHASQSSQSKRWLPGISYAGSKSGTPRRLASVPVMYLNQSPSRRSLKSIPTEYPPVPITTLDQQAKAQAIQLEHLKPNQDCPGWQAANQTLELFQTYLKDSHENPHNWMPHQTSPEPVKMWLNSTLLPPGNPPAGLVRLPLVKSETIMCAQDGSLPAPITKEQVLLTLLSSVAQREWDGAFAGHELFGSGPGGGQTLVSTDNGFDQGSYLGSMRAVFPHVRDESAFWYDQMVTRSPIGRRDDGVQAKIMVVQHSVEDQQARLAQIVDVGARDKLMELVDANRLGRVNVGGWLIQTGASVDEIQVVHLGAYEIVQPSSTLPPFASKIVLASVARRPAMLCRFIQTHGFFPGFVRWMAGPVECLGDSEWAGGGTEQDVGGGEGRVEWRFRRRETRAGGDAGAGSEGTKVGQEQVCWFQWSSQMYKGGIALTLEPPNAAIVRLVGQTHNTLQFNWVASGAVDVVLRARRVEARVGMVLLNGLPVVETVEPPERAGMAVARRSSRRRMAGDRRAVSGSEVVGVGVGRSRNTIDEKDPNIPTTNAPSPPPLPTQAPQQNGHGQSSHPDTQVSGPAGDPQVMLIISKELYFTRAQVAFLIACVGLAYGYGKFM